MIIDIHTHIAYHGIYPPSYLTGMLQGLGLPAEKIRSLIRGLMRDKTGEQHLRQMDKAGIDQSVLLIIDGGLGMEEPEMSLPEIFALHHQLQQAHPDRFIVFGGVDPRRGEEGLELFKKGIEVYGFRGMKLYPPMGYAMDDPGLMPFYALCNQHKLPVLLHSGPSLESLANHFAEPENILKVAQQFPDTNFILAHAGYSLHKESIREVLKTENVFADLAAFQTLKRGENGYAPELELIFQDDWHKKVLFGTDWPLFNLMNSLTHPVEHVQKAFESTRGATEEALKVLFTENAKGILREK